MSFMCKCLFWIRLSISWSHAQTLFMVCIGEEALETHPELQAYGENGFDLLICIIITMHNSNTLWNCDKMSFFFEMSLLYLNFNPTSNMEDWNLMNFEGKIMKYCCILMKSSCLHLITNVLTLNDTFWYNLKGRKQISWDFMCNWIYWKNTCTGNERPYK